MVAIEDIKDIESFEAWLQEIDLPREVFVELAVRTAMRILPVLWGRSVETERFPVVPVLRLALTSYLAGHPLTFTMGGMRPAGDARSALFQAIIDGADTFEIINYQNSLSYKNALSSIEHASQAIIAPDKFFSKILTIESTIFAVNAVDIHEYGYNFTILQSIDDIIYDDKLKLMIQMPLWSNFKPDWFEEDIRAVIKYCSEDWSFWINWYERALDGHSQNWPLLLEVAIQEEDFWKGTDVEINARIAQIVQRGVTIEVPTARVEISALAPAVEVGISKAALEKTENGEEIFVNADDQLEARPVTELTPAEFAEIVRRLKDVVALMQTLSTRTDAYSVVSIRLEEFGKLLNRRSKTPVQIHDACRRTIRYLDRSIDIDDLPKDDPNLEDLRSVLADSELELSQRDAKVRERLRLLADARFDQIKDEHVAAFKAETETLADVSTPDLAEDLRQDIETAGNPSADPQDRQEARYRWTSRFVRMYDQAKRQANRLGLTSERLNAVTAVAERVIRMILGGGG